MNTSSELKLARGRAGLSTEQEDVLNSFAAENDFIVPPQHTTYDPLARDMPFVFVPPQPVPFAPKRAARGRARRALTVLTLLVTAGWGVYVYQSSRSRDLDIIAAWASRLASPPTTVTRPAATAPIEARPNDPTDLDPRFFSNESTAPPATDAKADMDSKAPIAKMSDITRPAAAAPQATGTSGLLAAPAQSVSGEWRLDTQTETGESSFEGLKLHYEMKLTQDRDRVSGVGTKVSANEKETGPGAQTPVTMTGTIAGDRLTLNVVELGTQPETRGKLVLLVDQAGTLRGRFSSSAAPSSGHVEAHRR